MSKPILQALLLADHVYVDKASGKHVICGVFDRVGFVPSGQPDPADRRPGETPTPAPRPKRPLFAAGSPHVFGSVTEVRGEQALELRFVDLSDNRVLIRVDISIQSSDPLATVKFALPLPVLPIPHAGTYVLELLHDNEILGGHRVVAVLDSTTPTV